MVAVGLEWCTCNTLRGQQVREERTIQGKRWVLIKEKPEERKSVAYACKIEVRKLLADLGVVQSCE